MINTTDPLRQKVISSPDGRFKAMLATEDDLEEVAKLIAIGFSGKDYQPIINKIYPGLHTPEGSKVLAERLRAAHDADPTCYYVKVVDTTKDDMIVTQGKWYIRESDPHPTELKGPYWASEDARLAAQAEYQAFFKRRRQAINDTPGRVYCISALCCHPSAQGQGAGHLWARWGLEEADREGCITVVEASPLAIGFYKKQGFVLHEMLDCGDDLPEKWRKVETQRFGWMTRQPRGINGNGA